MPASAPMLRFTCTFHLELHGRPCPNMQPTRTSSDAENLWQEIFSTLGPVGEIKIIKDKLTGLSAGYGFVQYLDPRAAEMALQSLNGRVLHGQVCPRQQPRRRKALL